MLIEIAVIKEMIKNGKTDLEISKLYIVSPASIYLIRKGKNWKHLGE